MKRDLIRILIVEDDPGIAEAVGEAVRLWGMEAVMVRDFRKVTEEFAAASPHLVLLDLSLPFAGGWHWCAAIREISSVPIIVVSSAADDMNLVTAVNMGADDFVAKPFDTTVLAAKIQALLRRTYDYAASSPVLGHRGAWLRTGDCALSVDGRTVELTRNEYRILLLLLQNKGKVVSREKLMESLWESDAFVDENTLTVNVARLRKKLDGAGLADFIGTKFGVGYIVGGEGDRHG